MAIEVEVIVNNGVAYGKAPRYIYKDGVKLEKSVGNLLPTPEAGDIIIDGWITDDINYNPARIQNSRPEYGELISAQLPVDLMSSYTNYQSKYDK